MSASRDRQSYQHTRHALVRAVHHPGLVVPPVPDLSDTSPAGVQSWSAWLRQAWSVAELVDAVTHNSPALAQRLDEALHSDHQMSQASTRKLVLSLMGYCLRAAHRPTPLGLFAGVAEAAAGPRTSVSWGTDHRAVARADGEWMIKIITQLHGLAPVRQRLRVVCNNSLYQRGSRLVVPCQAQAPGNARVEFAEYSLGTQEHWTALRSAEHPIPYRELARTLTAEHPGLAPAQAHALMDEMLTRGILISNLEPPATETDALGYVLGQLAECDIDQVPQAGPVVAELREFHQLMEDHNQQPAHAGRALRATLTQRMTARCAVKQPVAVDLHLDAAVTVSNQVLKEGARALTMLARISPEPDGAPEWCEYRERFHRRYGSGTAVPMQHVLTGMGYPDGFLGTATPAPARSTLSHRDSVLLDRARQAVAAGHEIELDEGLADQLAVGDPAQMQLPAHVELLAEVHSPSLTALDAGRFSLNVRAVSPGWGKFSGGRFAALLATTGHPSDFLGLMSQRPTRTSGALPVQLSFLARSSGTHLARTPRLVAPLISLSEHRPPRTDTISPDDLAIMHDRGRLHLLSLKRGQVLEAAIPHPLEISSHTPVLARFLDELIRGTSTQLIGPGPGAFDWGAAQQLPVLPRVVCGRAVISPARWLLSATDLPDRTAGTAEWEAAFAWLRERQQVPPHVYLEHDGVRSRLDLDVAAHRVWLRSKAERGGQLSLVEAPREDAFGWAEGRVTELVLPMRDTAAPRPSPVLIPATEECPNPTPICHPQLPGISAYMQVHLFATRQAQRELILDHLQGLLSGLPLRGFWFRPCADPRPYLELVLRLTDPSAAGASVQAFSTWAQGLTATGVVSDIVWVPFRPHMGVWGNGQSLVAAESVFSADSVAIIYQMSLGPGVDSRALAAANIVGIASAFLGSTAQALQWLRQQPKPRAGAGAAPSPDVQQQASLLISGADGSAPLPELCGDALVTAWASRSAALAAYRAHLDPVPDKSEAVLQALISRHIQAIALTDEEQNAAWRLARAAALAAVFPARATCTGGDRV
ncbi:lantibiotic dehydratase [Streptomyces sp. NBC_01411]|uniref:lantibiotic dehydratase n=1 Tax=Streptomyces sp. NBC_01411 TaxID=2903857 RepID=UPI0032530956